MPEPALPRPLGPAGEKRTVAPGSFFERVARASRAHGVTRLADVTGLDRLGLPVWQAVRPAGRSLSVHQGKGASPIAARIGALCEAIECDEAEKAIADGPCCGLEALAAAERPPDLADYGGDRTKPRPHSSPIQWCRATDLHSGRAHYVPHACVSLDLTAAAAPSYFERSSTGLGLGASEGEAVTTALYEVVERDAVGRWDRSDPAARMTTALALDSIPFGWFGLWRDRCRALGIVLRVFAPDAITGVPAFIVSIAGETEFGGGYRRFSGTAVHGDAETALFKAMAEAFQSRLTFIAGVRDDILPSHYARSARETLRPPPTPGLGQRRWTEIEAQPSGWEHVADGLAKAGYRHIPVKRLDDGREELAVVKLFVPGLGSLRRTRRAPP